MAAKFRVSVGEKSSFAQDRCFRSLVLIQSEMIFCIFLQKKNKLGLRFFLKEFWKGVESQYQ